MLRLRWIASRKSKQSTWSSLNEEQRQQWSCTICRYTTSRLNIRNMCNHLDSVLPELSAELCPEQPCEIISYLFVNVAFLTERVNALSRPSEAQPSNVPQNHVVIGTPPRPVLPQDMPLPVTPMDSFPLRRANGVPQPQHLVSFLPTLLQHPPPVINPVISAHVLWLLYPGCDQDLQPPSYSCRQCLPNRGCHKTGWHSEWLLLHPWYVTVSLEEPFTSRYPLRHPRLPPPDVLHERLLPIHCSLCLSLLWWSLYYLPSPDV